MFITDVLNKCKEEGYPVTKSGLYYAGKKYGFLKATDKKRARGFSLEFNKDAFFEWLKKAKEAVPEGWVPIREIPKLLNISLTQAYILVKNENCGAKSFGAGPGVLYVDPERVKEVIKQRCENRKEKWS